MAARADIIRLPRRWFVRAPRRRPVCHSFLQPCALCLAAPRRRGARLQYVGDGEGEHEQPLRELQRNRPRPGLPDAPHRLVHLPRRGRFIGLRQPAHGKAGNARTSFYRGTAQQGTCRNRVVGLATNPHMHGYATHKSRSSSRALQRDAACVRCQVWVRLSKTRVICRTNAKPGARRAHNHFNRPCA